MQKAGKAIVPKKRKATTKAIVPALPMSEVLLPEVGGKKLSLVPTAITKPQILALMQRTPRNHVYTRPGKGGGTFEYVTGVYVKKVLNYVFGFNWDFRITEHGTEKDSVWVLGELRVRFSSDPRKPKNDVEVVKMQFGRADIKMKKTGGQLDFGNDLKSAATDALKKCASEFGIASDVYGKAEFKDLGVDIDDQEQQEVIIKTSLYDDGHKISIPHKDILKDTGINNDYSGKLKAEIIKRNNNKPMTEGQMLEYLNNKLGMALTQISSGRAAQMLLAQLLQKK